MNETHEDEGKLKARKCKASYFGKEDACPLKAETANNVLLTCH